MASENDTMNEEAVTAEFPVVPVELSAEAQATIQQAMDQAASEAAAKARAELEPVLIAEQKEKARLGAEAEAARLVAEAEAARVAAEEEAKRLADEEAARVDAERKSILVAEQTPRALKLVRQVYFRGGFGHGDIDAVLASLEPEAVVAAEETFNAELEKLAAQTKASPVPLSPAMQSFVSESKPKRRR